MQEVPALQALLRFVRFGLPWDFGRTITIARGDARPAVTIHGRARGRAGKATGRLARRRHPWPAGRAARSARLRNRSAGLALRLRGERRGKRQCTAALACPKAARPRHGQISNVGKGMPAIPRPQENEGVGEHVRTRFHVGPKAACEIAEPLEGEPHRTKKTCFFCRTGLWRANPRKRTIRPLT